MFKGEFCSLFTCYLRHCNILRHYGTAEKKITQIKLQNFIFKGINLTDTREPGS